MSKWKETIRRALRTFGQAAVGYIATNAVVALSGKESDWSLMKESLVGLAIAGIAAGLAALMNLPDNTKGDE